MGPPPSESSWKEMVSRRTSGLKPQSGGERRSVPPGSPGQFPKGRDTRREDQAAVRLRPPKSAVVSIKSIDESQSYADILKRARERINLGELGIKDPKVRFAANGGVLVEIPGPEGAKMANSLAEKLLLVMGEDYKISCPIKFGEIRVSGVDPSVGPEELTLALCGASGSLVKDFRLGPIRRNIRGNQCGVGKVPVGGGP